MLDVPDAAAVVGRAHVGATDVAHARVRAIEVLAAIGGGADTGA